MADPLLDNADVVDWLGAPVPTFSQQVAEGAVTGYCGWHVAPERTETIRVQASGSRVVLLPSLHIVDVTSVLDENGDPVTFTCETSGVLRLWAPHTGRLTVTYTHGYAECPDGVAGVVLSVLGRAVTNPRGLVQAQETRGPVTRSESYGASANEIGATGLLASERAVLDRYRLP